MNEIILMSDPRVAAVPVAECGERLVDVRAGDSLLVDSRKQDPAGAFALLREGALDRLLAANTPTGPRSGSTRPRAATSPRRASPPAGPAAAPYGPHGPA
ncbi:hypothetical protein M2167_004316 [Streptomyces sp. SPB4]|nr:hypothetical protein [Streptomyces sp. SPB4]